MTTIREHSEWNRGVLCKSSWHKLEKIADMPDAESMIREGEESGAWPTELRHEKLLTPGGLLAPMDAIVGTYKHHAERVLGVVSDSYRETLCEEWRGMVTAACAAGARPAGAFSLRGGSRVVATFDIPANDAPAGTRAAGIKSHLLMADAFDRSLRLTCGSTDIDVVCANTLSMSLREDGGGMGRFRHTASLEAKVRVLTEKIGEVVKNGTKVRKLMLEAEHTTLTRQAARRAFDLLFPEAPEDADKAAKTRAENVRDAAKMAATLPINRVGNGPGNLATLWNAATFLVDRNPNGEFRPTRSGDPLDSMLFGTRGKRVQEIQTLIEVIMRDGTVQTMAAPKAIEAGVDARVVGAKVLEEMLNDLSPQA